LFFVGLLGKKIDIKRIKIYLGGRKKQINNFEMSYSFFITKKKKPRGIKDISISLFPLITFVLSILKL